MKILIAEDDLTSRTMLAAVLKKAGHEVVETVDGTQAWEELRKPGGPVLAALDWMMPGMDGLDVVRRAREVLTERPPYIIMLTTRDGKADIIAGLEAGADDYLAKPYDAGELWARIGAGIRMLTLQDALIEKAAQLQQALDQVRTLRGIVPICASCKKIRDDQGYWNQVEVYVRDHTEAQFSHGICPECARKLYPEFYTDADSEKSERS